MKSNRSINDAVKGVDSLKKKKKQPKFLGSKELPNKHGGIPPYLG